MPNTRTARAATCTLSRAQRRGIEGSEADLREEEACAIYEMPQTDKSREVEEAMRQLAKDWP